MKNAIRSQTSTAASIHTMSRRGLRGRIMRLFYHPQEVSAMELKETLVYYRKRQGLSQIELAEELSVSRQTVSK